MVNPMFITTFGNLSLCGKTKSGVRRHTVAFHGYMMQPLIMYNAIYVRSYLGKHVRHTPSVCTCIQSSKTLLFVSLLYFETNWQNMSHIKTKCYSKYKNQYSLSVAKRVYSFEIKFPIFGRIVEIRWKMYFCIFTLFPLILMHQYLNPSSSYQIIYF